MFVQAAGFKYIQFFEMNYPWIITPLESGWYFITETTPFLKEQRDKTAVYNGS